MTSNIDYQLIVNRDELGFSECGVRVIAGYGEDSNGYLYDVRVFAQRKYNYVVMSGQRYRVSNHGPIPVMPVPTRFWIAQASEGVPIAADPMTTSDDGLYAMGTLNSEKAVKAIVNMVNGRMMHFNLTADARDATVLSFSLPIRPDSMQDLASCLTGMSKNLGK